MTLNVLPSKHEINYFVAIHVFVGLMLVFTGVGWSILTLGCLFLVLHFWCFNPKRQPHVMQIKFNDESWSLLIQEQWHVFRLENHASFKDKLIRLDFAQGWRRRSLSLWPDALSIQDHRRLRILLKHRIDMSV